MELLEIQDGRARVTVAPALGAGLASYEALRRDGIAVPLLRSWRPAAGADPFALAGNLLLPWSNRISGGGFSYQGRFHPLQPNWPGEKYPLHGNAFQTPWAVRQHTAAAVTLELRGAPVGPFHYAATVRYELRDGALETELSVENCGDETLPYGLGFHPWFPRHPGTRLRAAAAAVWHEDAEHLPTLAQSVAELQEWDFQQPRPLPPGWINNGFAGWNGAAEILQPEDGLSLTLSASETLGAYLLYSPSPASDFFCFEPVSHLVDAHHLKAAGGLVALPPGGRLAGNMLLDWRWELK
jgi:aldose 1-epimerase